VRDVAGVHLALDRWKKKKSEGVMLKFKEIYSTEMGSLSISHGELNT
jgi:hypothetical protein